jgi:hypothetical protein
MHRRRHLGGAHVVRDEAAAVTLSATARSHARALAPSVEGLTGSPFHRDAYVVSP